MSNRDAYRQFCREIPDLPVFLEPWYLDAAQHRESWDVCVVRHQGRIVAALPYFLKRQYTFKAIVLPVFVKFMGPVLHPDLRELSDQHRLYDQLIRQLPNIHSFKQNFHPDVINWLPFYWQGYQQTTRYTYRISIGRPEETFSGLAGNKRRQIVKAGRRLHLRHDLPLEEFYRVNKMSFDRQGLPIPYSFSQLARHDQALAENQARQLFFALDEQQQIHSVAYLIWDRQRAYFHLAGDDPTLRKSFAGFWLIWKCIEYNYHTLGLKEFDFEGSMIRNIESVRRHFGAYQVPYFYIWKYHSAIYRRLERLKHYFGK